jgi:hypothetical protein
MSNQKKNPKQLKQQLLDQLNKQQEAIEALSDEDLEAVAGGSHLFPIHAMNTTEVSIKPQLQPTAEMMPHDLPQKVEMGTHW